jgi:hypothetical protein
MTGRVAKMMEGRGKLKIFDKLYVEKPHQKKIQTTLAEIFLLLKFQTCMARCIS